jgi:hypothetical protein
VTEQPCRETGLERTPAELADRRNLHRLIVTNLGRQPGADLSLRNDVWTYVGIERHAGTSPGHVITALAEMIAAADIKPAASRHVLMRRVILWGVEAYFGHLDGDVMARGADAFSDSPATAAWPTEVASARPIEPVLPAVVPAKLNATNSRALIYSPLATQEAIAKEEPPFPSATGTAPEESWYADWRARLTRNLSRRSDGRWEPLTWFHSALPNEAV